MDELNLFPNTLTTTKVLVINEGNGQEVVSILRVKGVNAEIYLDSKATMEKQFK